MKKHDSKAGAGSQSQMAMIRDLIVCVLTQSFSTSLADIEALIVVGQSHVMEGGSCKDWAGLGELFS